MSGFFSVSAYDLSREDASSHKKGNFLIEKHSGLKLGDGILITDVCGGIGDCVAGIGDSFVNKLQDGIGSYVLWALGVICTSDGSGLEK